MAYGAWVLDRVTCTLGGSMERDANLSSLVREFGLFRRMFSVQFEKKKKKRDRRRAKNDL